MEARTGSIVFIIYYYLILLNILENLNNQIELCSRRSDLLKKQLLDPTKTILLQTANHKQSIALPLE